MPVAAHPGHLLRRDASLPEHGQVLPVMAVLSRPLHEASQLHAFHGVARTVDHMQGWRVRALPAPGRSDVPDMGKRVHCWLWWIPGQPGRHSGVQILPICCECLRSYDAAAYSSPAPFGAGWRRLSKTTQHRIFQPMARCIHPPSILQ